MNDLTWLLLVPTALPILFGLLDIATRDKRTSTPKGERWYPDDPCNSPAVVGSRRKPPQ